jgi:hypothetical protein
MVRELADAGKRAVALDYWSTGFDCAIAKDVPPIIGDTDDQNLLGLKRGLRRFGAESGNLADIFFALGIPCIVRLHAYPDSGTVAKQFA